MLEAIRSFSGNIIFKSLFILLILGFISWGASDVVIGNSSRDVAAWVGDAEINPNEVRREVQNEFDRLRQAFGGNFTREQARQFGLDTRVLNNIVNRTLLTLSANDLGIVISDQLVLNEIHATSAFQNALGKFDRQVFQNVLAQSGLSEAGYVQLTKLEVARRLLLESLQAGASAPAPLADNLFKYRSEKRKIEYVVVDDAGVSNVDLPREEVLEKFFKKDPAKFMAPELRKVSYLHLKADDIAKEIAIAEDAVKDAFESRKDEFSRAEKRQIKQIVVSDEAKAREAYDKLKTGKSFAVIAEDVAGMDQAAIDLGNVTKADVFLPELGNVAFALKKGEVSEPVKTSLGWHVMTITGITPGKEAIFDEVKDKLKAEIAKDKAIDGLFELANKMEDALAGGATLEEAAAEINVPVQTLDAIDSYGRNAIGGKIDTLPKGGNFAAIAFQTEEGMESRLTEDGSDAYYLLHVDKVTAPRQKTFKEAFADVAILWKEDAHRNASENIAKELIAKLEKEKDLAAATLSMGMNIQVAKPDAFMRDGSGAPQSLGSNLIASIFKAKKGEAVRARITNASIVARILDIEEANPATDKEAEKALREKLAASIRSDIDQQLSQALRQRYPVQINQDVMNQLN